MTSKIVTYDLAAPNGDYESLHVKLKAYTQWAKITQSCWFIKTDDSCKVVRNNLKSSMNDDDRLFVAALTGEAAWSNVICPSEGLKKRL